MAKGKRGSKEVERSYPERGLGIGAILREGLFDDLGDLLLDPFGHRLEIR